MGVTFGVEFGLVGFGFERHTLLDFELRLGVMTLFFMPALITAKMRKMRDDLVQARDLLSRKR